MKFVRTARRYRSVQIKAGQQIRTTVEPLPDDLRDAIATINAGRAHQIVLSLDNPARLADPPGGFATSPTTSRDHYWKPADSKPGYTLYCEEPN